MHNEHLHAEVERIATADNRSNTRVIAHLLIDAGRMSAVECGWSECTMPTRAFLPDTDPDWHPRHQLTISVDHVHPREFGGSDRPENIMLIHFGCNSSKGVKDRVRLGTYREDRAADSRERWTDPDYRARVTTKVAERMRDPEVAAKKSVSMKKAHERTTPEVRQDRAQRGWATRRKNQEKTE